MSTISFNVVVDMLAVLINRARENGDLAKARNMKLVLCLFEQLFGLKINFNKSELFCLDAPKKNMIIINSCSAVN